MKNTEKEFLNIREQIGKYKEKNLRIFASSSFQTQSAVLLHILSRIDNTIPVYFLNTGFHFPETLVYKNRLASQLGLTVIDLFPFVPKNQQQNEKGRLLFTSDPDYCCYLNKVQPLDSVLKINDVWISGVRSEQSKVRSEMNREDKAQYGVTRYHPLLEWTSKMIHKYIEENDLPAHPLEEQGFVSVGCQPCTQKTSMESYDAGREGRWYGMSKTECGIHTDLIVKD